MKNNSIKLYVIQILSILLCFAVAMSVISCASLKKTTVKEKGPTFAGDFEPAEIGTIMSISTPLTGGIKPREITVYFIPRNNNIEWYFKDTLNKVALILPYDVRQTLDEAVQMYMTAYNDDSKHLEDRAPDKKNYFNKGIVSISWGILGLNYNGETTFRTNYEYLEPNKPYFVLTLDSTTDKTSDDVYSTTMNLYFSPSQLEQLYNIMGNDTLEAYIAEKEKAAFEF